MSDGPLEIRFIANPTQNRFIVSTAKAALFSCRMGEGKSAALCWAIWYHTRRNPGARWLLIRDTWESLQRTTQKEFFKWFPDGIMGKYHKGEKTFTWQAKGLRGEVLFMGLDDPKDAAKLQSMEIAGAAIDEPAPAADSGGIDEYIFDVLLSRLRQPGVKDYSVKLATNNPDETHWCYRRFAGEEKDERFELYKTRAPENVQNLPPGYYEDLAKSWEHRPDLKRRFVEGEFGFQQKGRSVTPEWSDALHLADRLKPVRGYPLELFWDFGLNPTCTITQSTPIGLWLVLECHVGQGIGAYELIEDVVKPALTSRYPGFEISHGGDPAGLAKEQSSSRMSAVKVIRRELGGAWRSGPPDPMMGLDPLKAVLRKTFEGKGIVRVDRVRAKPVWHALRGGWHYKVHNDGTVSERPKKDGFSHPGDTMAYGAAIKFPLGVLVSRRGGSVKPKTASYWRHRGQGLGFERPGLSVPKGAERIGG